MSPRGPMRHVLMTLLLCPLALACGSPVPEGEDLSGVSAVQQQIVGGTASTDGAVVALADGRGYRCTGTLLAPRTVLTTASCTQGNQEPLFVWVGPNLDAPAQVSQVLQIFVNADRDVALLKLVERVTSVTPLEITPYLLTPGNVGNLIRHIGYGASSTTAGAPPAGRLSVSHPITALTDTELESGAAGKQVCRKDTGAPGLMLSDGRERVVSIAVRSDDVCPERGSDVRVDVLRTWITDTFGAWEQISFPADGGMPTSPPVNTDGGMVDAGEGGSTDGGWIPRSFHGFHACSSSSMGPDLTTALLLLIATTLRVARARRVGR